MTKLPFKKRALSVEIPKRQRKPTQEQKDLIKALMKKFVYALEGHSCIINDKGEFCDGWNIIHYMCDMADVDCVGCGDIEHEVLKEWKEKHGKPKNESGEITCHQPDTWSQYPTSEEESDEDTDEDMEEEGEDKSRWD